jgi:monoamine oxidase
MTNSDTDVLIIGGGAAGIAAGRRLAQAAITFMILEARPRLGGRAWTVNDAAGPFDLGCGWLHSADRNPWAPVALAQGRTIDKSPPPWAKSVLPIGFPPAEQQDFARAREAYFERLEAAAKNSKDAPAAACLEPGNRWNGMIGAIGTYISGGELEDVSTYDFDNYADSGTNWRIVEGYGATIAAHGASLPVMLDCPVLQIGHGSRRLKVETAKGMISADQAIVTLPTSVIAEKEFLFSPALPDKTEAAHGLPLGLADKLFMALEDADAFESDSRLFGHIDRTATANYHFRPFGRPVIEAYFGGRLAADLDASGEDAFFDFAKSELTRLFGHQFARKIKPLHVHCWGADPFARGSYSYALPGKADCRAVLAATVDDRLFFAGEACSKHDFSTAHGAYLTGVAAADAVIAARARRKRI